MTAALQTPVVSCPVCGGEMYDNRGTKKNPKQPDFKCKRYKEGCEGVIWPPKGGRAVAQLGGLQKAANSQPPVATSNVPNQQLPPLLQNAEAEDAKELAEKIGPPEKPKLMQVYLDATEFILNKIVPLYEAKEIGVSDTACAAMVATLVIQAGKER